VITPASAAPGKYLQRRLKWNTCNGKRNYIGAVGGKHQQQREIYIPSGVSLVALWLFFVGFAHFQNANMLPNA